MNQKIFLSGGFKSDWQSNVITTLGGKFIFFNPREHNLNDPSQYTAWDIHYVKQCDILFAYMEESNPSGYGLMLEIGLAHGLGKTIILIDERSKIDNDFARYFKMAHHISNVVFDNLAEAILYLRTLI